MFQYLLLVVALLSPFRLSDARDLLAVPNVPDDGPCCDNEDRVCCDGQCFPPGTAFLVACESESCGCPNDKLGEDCCPPFHYCCYSRCSHNSVLHVWCGPPDAPTCCDVLEGGGDGPTAAGPDSLTLE